MRRTIEPHRPPSSPLVIRLLTCRRRSVSPALDTKALSQGLMPSVGTASKVSTILAATSTSDASLFNNKIMSFTLSVSFCVMSVSPCLRLFSRHQDQAGHAVDGGVGHRKVQAHAVLRRHSYAAQSRQPQH